MWRAMTMIALCGVALSALMIAPSDCRDAERPVIVEGVAPVDGELASPTLLASEATSTRVLSAQNLDSAPQVAGLSVRVIGERGEPIERARVELLSPASRRGIGATVIAGSDTDEQGTGEISLVDSAPGSFLRATSPGRAIVLLPLPAADAELPFEITLPRLTASGLIGRMTYMDGLPATDVLVELTGRDPVTGAMSRSVDRSLVEADGHYECRRASPGNYVFAVRQIASSRVVERREIALGPDTTRLDLILQSTGALMGRIHDSANRSIAGSLVAQARAGHAIGKRILTAWADAETGRFEIQGVPAGEYVIDAQSTGLRAEPVTIRVEAGETLDVDIELEPAGALNGQLIASNLVTAQLSLFRTGEAGRRKIREVQVDATGAFTIEHLPFGEYRLEVESPDHAPSATTRILLSDADPTESVNIVLEQGAVLYGVATAIGRPLPRRGAVRLRNESIGTLVLPVEFEAGGTFQVRRIPSGRFNIELRCEGFCPKQCDVEFDNESRADVYLSLVEKQETGITGAK